MPDIAGLKLIVPTSVAGSGVSVSASGKVTFTAATSVSVNGVFDSTYDNYLAVVRFKGTSGDFSVDGRLRVSGSDNSTSNSYTRQLLIADSTSVSAGRNTNTFWSGWLVASATQQDGAHIYLYGPALAQPTAMRTVCVSGASSAYISDCSGTHNQSTAYDGFTIYAATSITGTLTIYGLAQ